MPLSGGIYGDYGQPSTGGYNPGFNPNLGSDWWDSILTGMNTGWGGTMSMAPTGTGGSTGLNIPDIISTGINIAGMVGSTEAGKAQNRMALEHAEKMYRNRYQWTVQDMIAAGLNPMLAAGGQPVGSTPHLQSMFSDRLAGEASESVRGYLDRRASRNLITSQINKNEADAELAAQSKVRAVKEGNLLDAQKIGTEANTARTIAEKLKILAETREVGPSILGTKIPRIDLQEMLDDLNSFNSSAKDVREPFRRRFYTPNTSRGY